MVKERSPNYPAVGLKAAIEMARKFWDKERRTSVSLQLAVKAIGYKSLSGPARTKIAALRQYGLLDKDKRGFRLSGLAKKIVNHSPGSEDYEAAVRTAAMQPELFKELLRTHSEASDDSLRSYLAVEKSFSDMGSRQCVQSFRDTINLAKLNEGEYSGLDEAQEEETMATTPVAQSGVNDVRGLPLSDGVKVDLRFLGPVVQEDIEKLIKYLELFKTGFRVEREESDE